MFIWEEVFGPDVWQTLSPSDVAQLAWFANRNISTNYAAFTAFTWVAYDTLLTLGRESQFVWSRRPSAMTAIYVINRYVYIAVCVLDVTQAVFTKDDESCKVQGITTLVLTFLVYMSQAAFTAIRLFAIWDHSLKLAVFIAVLHSPPLVLDVVGSPFTRPGGTYAIEYFPGCFQTFGRTYMISIIVRRVMTLTTDTIVLVLTWAKTYSIRREAQNFGMHMPISMMLLRDGTLHFLVFLALSILDLVMASMQTTILVDYASLFLQAFRSITVCHFILHLREVYLMGDDTGTNNPVVSSFLQFASQAVGNLGAPLDLDDMDSDGHSRADSSEWVSRNPLAAGLPMMSPSDEHVALNRDSMSSATESTVDLKDVFDDDCEEYAQRYLSLVRRRGTGEESILDGSHESRSLLCDEPDDMDAGATKNADNIAV